MRQIDFSILKGSLTGQITAVERADLEKWLASSADNRHYYDRMKHFFECGGKERVDVDANLRRFLRRAHYPARRRALLISSAAACMSIIMVLSIGGNHDKEIILNNDSGIVLHVGQAETIILEPGVHSDIPSHSGFSINQQDGMIDYHTQDKDRTVTEIHTLETLHGSKYQLSLDDGTRVWLNAESKISYPAVFSGNERRVRISGELYFDIQPSDIPFILEAGGSEIRVLGTEFNVRSYDGERISRTTLLSGKLGITANGQTVVLEPGEQAVMERDGDLLKQKVDVGKVVAWKYGHIAFDDERLEDIMEQLRRWYDIEVEFEDQELRDMRFTGDINQHDDINVLFRQFEKTRIVRFRVGDGRVTVKKY